METIANHNQARRKLMATRPLRVIAMAVLLAVAFGSTATAWANSQSELDPVRAATERFKSTDVARRAGYEPFMECFDNPGVGAMGYHYVNGSLLDLTVDALAPEAMVYEADANGRLSLVAVEYIVPAKEWNAQNTDLPTLFGQKFHLNEKLGVLVLHAWIFKDNPAGVYEDWNPAVSCRALQSSAPGMPRTGLGDTLPIGIGIAAITGMMLALGLLIRRRSQPTA